ncbi:GDSL esterase/lipase At5g55050-like [Wolffia australiana]
MSTSHVREKYYMPTELSLPPARSARIMGNRLRFPLVFWALTVAAFVSTATASNAVPAIYVFGDSTVDVGNNNFFGGNPARANFPPHGIDFPGRRPTGRFSNGYNGIDYLAMQLGFRRSPPAYLSLTNIRQEAQGVNFASGASGIFDSTSLYNRGARKFLVSGTGSIGCVPIARLSVPCDGCFEYTNNLSRKSNSATKIALHKLAFRLPGFSYSLFNPYDFIVTLTSKPQNYGFKEVIAACCGSGKLNAESDCTPNSTYCSNRNEYFLG